MKPVNSKSLFHFVCDTMDKLDSGVIDGKTAKSQACLAKNAIELLNYELERTETLIKMDDHNRAYGTNVELRNIEGKNFD